MDREHFTYNNVGTLANTEGDDVSLIGIDGHEVVGDHLELVSINGKLHDSLCGGVNQTKKILCSRLEGELRNASVGRAKECRVCAWIVHLAIDQNVVG